MVEIIGNYLMYIAIDKLMLFMYIVIKETNDSFLKQFSNLFIKNKFFSKAHFSFTNQ